MGRDEFIRLISSRAKLVRIEYGFSQEQMAAALGISKKTLVESEKGRRVLSWSECVALAAVFAQSQVLQNEFGGELSDIITAIAFENTHVEYPLTMGGKVWWRLIEEQEGYQLQQNILSLHYRLLDPHDGRMMSSFDINEIKDYMRQLGIETQSVTKEESVYE